MSHDPLPPSVAGLPSHCVRPLASLQREALRQLAAQQLAHYVEVQLAACADKDSLMAELARTLGFPDWFGGNLDALYDALTDLPGPDPWLIVLDGLLVNELDRDARDSILDVFRDAADDFSDRGIGFRVFYD